MSHMKENKDQGPVVQSNSLTVVAKVFSNTLIFLLQKYEYAKATHIFFCKNINVFAIFQDRNFNVMLVYNIKF